jgi:flagellar basal-body rod protein FlgG
MDEAALRLRSDLGQGRLSRTENPLDVAISGAGLFQLRAGEEIVYSRQGHFRVAEDGTVVSGQGHVLQQAGGGDLSLQSSAVEITEDGTILDAGRPVARIALFAPADGVSLEASGGGTIFAAGSREMEEVAAPALRQGMVEASNVVLGDEMVAMMAALRQAESGARLVQLYDDLLGRAITTFGGGK